jgi:hypothetical protein
VYGRTRKHSLILLSANLFLKVGVPCASGSLGRHHFRRLMHRVKPRSLEAHFPRRVHPRSPRTTKCVCSCSSITSRGVGAFVRSANPGCQCRWSSNSVLAFRPCLSDGLRVRTEASARCKFVTRGKRVLKRHSGVDRSPTFAEKKATAVYPCMCPDTQAPQASD